MNIFEEIRSALRRKYEEGMTQQEIAEYSGLSRGHVCKLLNGTRSFSDVSLGNFFNLFPKAQIIINGAIASTAPNSKLENKLLTLFRELDEDDKLEALVYLSRLTANKSEEAATTPDQKIG